MPAWYTLNSKTRKLSTANVVILTHSSFLLKASGLLLSWVESPQSIRNLKQEVIWNFSHWALKKNCIYERSSLLECSKNKINWNRKDTYLSCLRWLFVLAIYVTLLTCFPVLFSFVLTALWSNLISFSPDRLKNLTLCCPSLQTHHCY